MSQTLTQKIIIRTILGIVLLSAGMALVFTGNSSTLNSGETNQEIARIGGKSVNAVEFSRIYARALEQNGLQDSMARQMGVPAMILQREIERQILAQSAQKMGIRIDNKYVATQLKQQLNNVTVSGTPQEKLQLVLSQQKMSESELVELLRSDFAINLLASSVATGDLNVPPTLVASSYRAEKEQRSADIIPITQANIKKTPVNETDAKAFFEENKENYRVPETRDVAVLVLPQSLFIKDAAIPENEIRAYYDAHKDQFMSPERARLEQVVAPDEKAAKAIMEAKPASLEKYKDDKNQFLKADWYGRNIMPKDFIKTLYPAKPAGLVGPIKTALGWHVLNVISYEDAKPLSFDEAKATIAEQLKAQKNDEQMNVFSGELDELIASEPSLEAIATKYNQKTETISGLSINEAGEQLKKSALPTAVQQRVKEAAFTLESDEISPLLDSSAGDYALVQIKRIVPAAIPEFAAVRDRVTADAQKSRDAKDLTALSEKLIGLYDAKKPEAFDKAVKEAGLTVQPLPPSDKAAVTAKFNKETAELLFTLSPENPLSYTQNSGTTTLLRLRDILPSSEAPDDKTKTTLNDAIKNNVIQELQQQFLAGWQQQLGIKVNEQVLKNTFGPQAQAEKE